MSIDVAYFTVVSPSALARPLVSGQLPAGSALGFRDEEGLLFWQLMSGADVDLLLSKLVELGLQPPWWDWPDVTVVERPFSSRWVPEWLTIKEEVIFAPVEIALKPGWTLEAHARRQRLGLLNAYLNTDYAVTLADGGQAVLRIGHRSNTLADLFESSGTNSAAFITAYNPFGREQEAAENAEAQARLQAELEQLIAGSHCLFVGEGRGQNTDWPPEPSFLALGLSYDQAGDLAERYQQAAIVFAGADAVPRLCLGYVAHGEAGVLDRISG